MNVLTNKGYIIVNKILIRKLGLECAILIGELCSEYSYWEKDILNIKICMDIKVKLLSKIPICIHKWHFT